MADTISQPPTSLKNRAITVESNSANSVNDELAIIAHTSQEPLTADNDEDKADNDLIEMQNMLQNIVEKRSENHMKVSHVEISIPNRRISNKYRLNRRRNSKMGSQNIMGDAILKLSIPETTNDIDREHSKSLQSLLNNGVDDEAINEIITILKKSINDRETAEVAILVSFFDQFQAPLFGDTLLNSHKFRAVIKDTKYLYLGKHENINDANDNKKCFYFVLFGAIGGYDQNQVFGFEEMYKETESINNYASDNKVHLAYWEMETYNAYIRPTKDMNHNIASEEVGLIHDKHGNLLTENDLIEKASMFLDDAIHGRDFKWHRNGEWPKEVNKFLNKKWVRYFLIFMCLLWLLVIQFEPPSTIYDSDPKTTTYEYIMPILCFEWVIFIVLLIECLLRLYSFGRKWFFKNHILHKVRVVLLVIFFFDLAFATIRLGHSFALRRLLRPFFLMLFIRDLRKKYYILAKTFPSIIEIIMLYLALTGIFARIGYHIFHDTTRVYNATDFFAGTGVYETYLKNRTVPSNALEGDYIWYSFDTFFWSAISLFSLLTTETFPEVLWPAYLSKHVYYAYFLVYLLISTYFLMNLFSASVYNAYLSIMQEFDVFDEEREEVALKVAWKALDYDEKGYIEQDRFGKLIKKLKPKYSEFEINVLFQLMDPNMNGTIEEIEFNDMMINCLYFSISKRSNSREDEMKLYLQSLGKHLGRYGYDILSIFASKYYKNFILFIVSLDVCALLSYHQSEYLCNYTDAICITLIIIGTIINIIIFKPNRYFADSSQNLIFFIITIIQCIGSFVGFFMANSKFYYISGLRFFGISRVLVMAAFVRERSKLKSTVITKTVIYMIPVFLRICFYLFVGLLYLFTVIGMELFYDWHDPTKWGKSRCDALLQLEQNTYALFCDTNASLVTLFQILTTNNWHIIMYEAITLTDNYFVTLYFILYFVLGPILVVNFLLAVFFDMFSAAAAAQQETENALLHQIDEIEQQKFEQLMNNNNNLSSDHSGEYPTECGINVLSDGSKILTIDSTGHMHTPPKIEHLSSNGFIHISLKNVCQSLFSNMALSSFTDANGNVFNETFDGETAVNCFCRLSYAPDHEDACDYLSQIMEKEAAFSRIDNSAPSEIGVKDTFENNQNAHYQWNIVFDALTTQPTENMSEIGRQITIGVRHSYGGFQRLMKHNRRTGGAGAASHSTQVSALPDCNSEQKAQGLATPKANKANLFSTRNLLDFQNNQSSANANKSPTQFGFNNHEMSAINDEKQIKNSLVILIGDSEQKQIESVTADYVNTFENHYKFKVTRSKDFHLTVSNSKYFSVNKYDSVIVILNQYRSPQQTLAKDIYEMLRENLRLENLGGIPKVIICINDEFEESVMSSSSFGNDFEEMYDLFGVIETKDAQFSNCFVTELNKNLKNEKGISLIALFEQVTNAISNQVYLNKFDPRLLMYKIMPNK